MSLWLPNDPWIFFLAAGQHLLPLLFFPLTYGKGIPTNLLELFKCSIHRDFYYSNNLTILNEKLEIVKNAE